MALRESKATQVLNIYLNFCEALQRDREITDRNFNRIRIIDSCIGGQQESVRADWGNLFDEVYCLLEQPEIKSRLEKEKKEIQLIREKRKHDKQNYILVAKTIKEAQTKTSSTNLKVQLKSSKKADKPEKNQVQRRLPIKKRSKIKKQKQAERLQSGQKNKEKTIQEQSIKQLRETFWRSVERAKLEEQVRKKVKRQSVQPNCKVSPTYIYDESSIFEDIMDERRAEGKGYGGAK